MRLTFNLFTILGLWNKIFRIKTKLVSWNQTKNVAIQVMGKSCLFYSKNLME
jgi:hypothetical protein